VLKIDSALLHEIGLGALPEPVASDLLRHIYETLEMRVGVQLADAMTNDQLDEFERYFEAKDDSGAFAWLETNFPNYQEIVATQFAALKQEIAANSDAILASAAI
jgi:hypothetical protein